MRPALALIACVALAGCAATTPSGGTGERRPATLPEGYRIEGPIAQPALTARRINASVRAVIEPLGTVPFDGLVLPLVSPDGTRLVTQTGTPPTWPTVLGEPGAGPSLRTRLELYDITQSPPQRIRLRTPIDSGVLLGRACDNRGFLVEEPRPDGSRRVGLASWGEGVIDWVADEPGYVFMGATLTEDGDVIATRRAVDEASGALWSSRLGILAESEGTLYAYPMTSGVPGEVGAIAISEDRGSELTWWTYRAGQPIVRARRLLNRSRTMISSYQATDSFRAVAPTTGNERPGVLLYGTSAGRTFLFEPTRADLVPLADKSIAGAWAPDEGGWAVLLTTPEGLVHQRLVSRGGVWEALPPASVLADSYVPRATNNPDRPFVLIGPSGEGATRRLSLVGLELLFNDEEER